jgi:putative endonuclease
MFRMKQINEIIKEDKRTEKRKVGDLGEQIACEFLMKHGFEIVERKYLRAWGEIDIIVRNGSKLHFVEVKTVSHVTVGYRPEDNLHFWKLERLGRVIQTYLASQNRVSYVTSGLTEEIEWQFDIVIVYLESRNGGIEVKYLEDITI